MKKSKQLLFKVHGKTVEQVDGETHLDIVDEIKINVAFIHAVPFGDVEVIAEDIIERELSTTCAISNSMVGFEKGKLIFRSTNPNSLWRLVNRITPSMDIRNEELRGEFVELLSLNDIDDAIIFN